MNRLQLFILINIGGILLGSLLIIGTALKWDFLINPSYRIAIFDILKPRKPSSDAFLIGSNYVTGAVIILACIAFIISALCGVPIK